MNIIRGFRRIGWVVTVPVAAFVVLVFFESTKEYSASNYEARSRNGACEYGSYDLEDERFEAACFPKDVPLDIANKVATDFANNGADKWYRDSRKGKGIMVIAEYQFTVHKRVNKLVGAAVAISALVNQV